MPCCLEEGQPAKRLLKVFLNPRSFVVTHLENVLPEEKSASCTFPSDNSKIPLLDKCLCFSDLLPCLIMNPNTFSVMPEASTTNLSECSFPSDIFPGNFE